MGVSNSWMVYNGNPMNLWMIRGYPYFRKPPYWGFCAETNIGWDFGDKNWRKYDRKNWQFYRDPTGRTCWWFSFRYPLVMTNIAMDNGHLQWVFPLKNVIFHSYVSLPEGKFYFKHFQTNKLTTHLTCFLHCGGHMCWWNWDRVSESHSRCITRTWTPTWAIQSSPNSTLERSQPRWCAHWSTCSRCAVAAEKQERTRPSSNQYLVFFGLLPNSTLWNFAHRFCVLDLFF